VGERKKKKENSDIHCHWLQKRFADFFLNPESELSSRKTLSQYLFNSDFMLTSEMKQIGPMRAHVSLRVLRLSKEWADTGSERIV
jgi:hypothetical protein